MSNPCLVSNKRPESPIFSGKKAEEKNTTKSVLLRTKDVNAGQSYMEGNGRHVYVLHVAVQFPFSIEIVTFLFFDLFPE